MTGVQTCALPISGSAPDAEALAATVFNLPVNINLAAGRALDARLQRLQQALGRLLQSHGEPT